MKDFSAKTPNPIGFSYSYLAPSLGAWLCFCVILTILNFLTGRRNMMDEFIGNAILVLCCALGTHLVRMLIISSGKDASWHKITIRAFLIGIPLFSLLMSILVIEIMAMMDPDKLLKPHHTFMNALLGLWFFMAVLFSGWTGVYVSAIAIQKSSKAEVERLSFETALREAELRALKAQINPHFLFNSLNTIRALVNERPDRAQEAVLHLSLLLRVALQSDTLLRSLRDELDTATHYLELEKLRFEERLTVTIDVEPEMMDVLIPTMLVQTLVENAVKHGIGCAVNGGELAVKGHIVNERCILKITNPGHLTNASSGTGVGLKNARMRLSRLLGEDAKVRIYEEGMTVVAELDVPVRKDDKRINS